MATTFATMTDYFGLADTNWALQSSSITPETQQAQAEDAQADVSCEERYAATASVEVVYRLQTNGTDGEITLPSNFKGGYSNTEDTTDYVITGGTLALSNSERPTLTVTGVQMHGETAGLPEYDFATAIGSIFAGKIATAVGFTLTGETKANSCNVSASCETVNTLDDSGEIAIVDVYQGRLESAVDTVTCEGAQSIAAAGSWELTADSSEDESNEGFLTGSATVFQNLTNTATTTTTTTV